MNINGLIKTAERQGYEITVDKSGRQYAYTIHDTKCPINKDIHIDRRGLELFLLEGVDEYLDYCWSADIEPFC